MKWKVENALNRDVERQHLNKILREIEASISSSSTGTSGLTESRVRDIVQSMIPAPQRPRAFTLSLDGDVTGQVTLNGNDATLQTTLDVDVLEEVPQDGYPYWRRYGEWAAVPTTLFAIANLVEPGFVSISPEDGSVFSRQFEAVEGELVVDNPDGVSGNVTYGLADVENTGIGDPFLKLYTRDAKGRIVGDEIADTDNLLEGDSNLFFTDERAQDAVGSIIESSDEIHFTYDDSFPSISAVLSQEVWDVINSAVNVVGTPTNADIIEFDDTVGGWVPKKNPRELLLDGGNF